MADYLIFWLYVVWVVVAGFAFWRYFPRALGMARDGEFTETFYLAAGVAAVSLGSGANRLYWVVWRGLRDAGFLESATWMADSAPFIGLLGFFVVSGYLSHIRAAYGLKPTAVIALSAVTFAGIVTTAVVA